MAEAESSSDEQRAGVGGRRTAVVALGAADAGLAAALREVVGAALERFPLAITEVPAAPAPRGRARACRALEDARVVVAQVSGADPEVLVRLARRGRAAGRTILLAPGPPGRRGEGDVIRHPATAREVRARAGTLSNRLAAAIRGDRAAIAAEAEGIAADVLAGSIGRERRLRRLEASTIPVAEPDDPAAVALCRAYAALGRWADVVRLGDGAASAGGVRDTAALPAALVRVYAMALNRRPGERDRAVAMLREHLDLFGADSELLATLGRTFKDRWEEGGRTDDAVLEEAIDAYRAGFDLDGDYYPGINALTLMHLAGRDVRTVRRLARAVRESVARGPNPGEHPWWHWATRVQVEVLAGDLRAADEALDGLLAQPAEPWMRESTADDLARIAGRASEEHPTRRDVVADTLPVRRVLAIRQAVLDGARPGRRLLPPHCVLEVTRRGTFAFASFTNREPRPLFCRYSESRDALEPSPAGLRLETILDPRADAARRADAIEGAGAELATHFRLDETSFTGEVCIDDESYLVVQVDEATAVEPWELFAQEREEPLSLRTTFARRLWLADAMVRRPTGRRGEARALVIGDPRDDLPAARAEARAVAGQLRATGRFPGGVTDLIGGAQATRRAVIELLDRGSIDLLHYAGHCEGVGEANGFVLAGDEILAPTTLRSAPTTPVLVVANACSSAAVLPAVRQPGFVTALAAAGVGVYVGCAWPVGDAQARTFSEAFYAEVLAGRPVGRGVRCGRLAIRERHGDDADPHWPAYVLYGNPWYQLIDASSDAE